MNTAARPNLLLATALLAAVAAGTASAATYVVSPDGLGDFPTIQAAVDAAGVDDVIELTDGTFRGDGNRDIAIPRKAITIRSQSNDPSACVIDCEGSAGDEHRGLYFIPDVYSGGVRVEGIGIVNGYTTTFGAGIWVEDGHPEFSYCSISSCTAAGDSTRGGGIFVNAGALISLFRCEITGNTAGYGGGVAATVSYGGFDECEISGNEATVAGGGVWTTSGSDLEFGWCDITGNSAPEVGGILVSDQIWVYFCTVTDNVASSGHAGGVLLQDGRVTTTTIVGNSAALEGGGVYFTGGTGDLRNSIIAYTGAGVAVGASQWSEPSMYCCDVYGNVDGNYDAVIGDQTGIDYNFSEDPQFCDIAERDYLLFDTSPCASWNSPCGSTVGRYWVGCTSAVQGMSWGRVKALYR